MRLYLYLNADDHNKSYLLPPGSSPVEADGRYQGKEFVELPSFLIAVVHAILGFPDTHRWLANRLTYLLSCIVWGCWDKDWKYQDDWETGLLEHLVGDVLWETLRCDEPDGLSKDNHWAIAVDAVKNSIDRTFIFRQDVYRTIGYLNTSPYVTRRAMEVLYRSGPSLEEVQVARDLGRRDIHPIEGE